MAALDAERLAHRQQRQVLVAAHHHPGAAGQAVRRGVAQGQRLDHGAERDDETLVADGDGHAVQHRQRQRQGDGDADARAGVVLQRHPAAQHADVAPDHVHADAAAGHVGDRIRGAQAGVEDELVDLLRRQNRAGRDHAALDRLGQHPVAVDAAPVVGDADHHPLAALPGADRDRALARLAGPLTLLRRLDAVVHGVADDVNQRLGQLVDHRAVDLRVFARDIGLDLLAELLGEVAHQPGHAREHPLHRLRPDRHDAFLQLADLARHGVGGVAKLEIGGLVVGQGLGHRGLGDDNFADHVDQPVDALQIDPQGARGLAWRGAGRQSGRGGFWRRLGRRERDRLGHAEWRRGAGWLGGGRGLGPALAPGDPDLGRGAVDLEEAVDGVGVGPGLQDDFPGQRADVRVEIVQRRDVPLDLHLRRAEPVQRLDQPQRVVAAGLEIRPRREADAIGSFPGRVERLLGLGSFGGGFGGRGRRRHPGVRLGAAQRREFFYHRLGGGQGGGLAIAGALDQVAQHVAAANQNLADLRRSGEAVAADRVHRRLEGMGESDQFAEAEGIGAALDRMHGAERGIDDLGVAGAFGEGAEAVLQVIEQLVAFLEEDDGIILDIAHPHALPVRPTVRSGPAPGPR